MQRTVSSSSRFDNSSNLMCWVKLFDIIAGDCVKGKSID